MGPQRIVIVFTLALLYSQLAIAQKIVKNYKISSCITNCSNKSEVFYLKEVKNQLHLKVGAQFNCALNSTAKVLYMAKHDTLNIITDGTIVKRDTVTVKTDTSTTVIIKEESSSSYALCNCYYQVELVVDDYQTLPKVILINGLSLADNYERRTTREIKK